MLPTKVDDELISGTLEFCKHIHESDVELQLAHNDLGSGTDLEQHIFDLEVERDQREAEKAFHEKKKLDSSKAKDFSVSANMRRKATEGIESTTKRLQEIGDELRELEGRQVDVPWYLLCNRLAQQQLNQICHLDLSNCGLHATAIKLLTGSILELEHRADGHSIRWLALDGNDLGDTSSGPLASLLRLSSAMQVLQLRNVGFTELGVSQAVAGLVTNKGLLLLDLRSNGLCSNEAGGAAIRGVRRFNTSVEILFG